MSAYKEQLVIVWRVYEPCNLGCHFCGYSRDIIRKRHIVNPDVILNFGKILSQFQQQTGIEVLVTWLGGEPLLWKELPNLSRVFHHELGIKLGITTNGTLLDREDVCASLIADYSFVTLSIDGFANFHDFHRGEKELFEKTKWHTGEILKKIKSSNSTLKLRVNTILMRENIQDFEEFCMEIADWGVQELTFNQLGGIDRPGFYTNNHLLPEQAEWLKTEFSRIQQNALVKGLAILGGQHYLDRIIATSKKAVISINDCAPGKKFLFINEENLVSPCNFTTAEYGISLAEIENVNTLIKLQKRFRYKQQHEQAMACNNCHSTQIFEKFNTPPQLIDLQKE